MDPATAYLIAGATSSVVNGVSTALTNAKNMKLAKYAYSKQLEMWNKQNEYNSPSNQMLRLAKAGLNPNLVYGNGSVVGNTTSDYPKFSAPTFQRYQNNEIMETAQAYQNLQLQKAQINNINAQTNKTKTETDKLESGRDFWADNSRLENDLKGTLLLCQKWKSEDLRQIALHAKDKYDVQLENLKKAGHLTDAQIKLIDTRVEYIAKDYLLRHNKIALDFMLGVGNLEVRKEANRIAMFNATTGRMRTNATIQVLKEQALNVAVKNDIANIDYLNKDAQFKTYGFLGMPLDKFTNPFSIGSHLVFGIPGVMSTHQKGVGKQRYNNYVNGKSSIKSRHPELGRSSKK